MSHIVLLVDYVLYGLGAVGVFCAGWSAAQAIRYVREEHCIRCVKESRR